MSIYSSEMTSGAEKTDLGDSEQDEENVYEVERIIDVRTEEGEVLYRVRWKNYASDDDTWEPEAHLDDCREVLLAYKRALAEAEAKKGLKLPMKSDVFDADSSESDKERPSESPAKKKKKKKKPQQEDDDEESSSKEKRKKKKEKRKEDIRPRPAPESDEEDERAPSPPAPAAHKEKPTDAKKRLVDSEDEDEVPVPSKKHRKSKTKEGGKHRKERSEESRPKKGGKKEQRHHEVETSEEEGTAPLEEDLSDEPSESQTEDHTGKSSERGRGDHMPKKKTGKSELKLQGIKDFLHDKRSKKLDTPSPTLSQRENKLKSLSSSRSRDEAVPLSSDSSDSSSLHKKAKSKGVESAAVPPKVPSSASSTSSSSSIAAASTSKAREDEAREDAPKEKEQSASTSLFETFLLNCEAKDRVPRRQAFHQPSPAEAGKGPKLIGKIEKRAKSAKESPGRRSEEKTEKPRHAEEDKMEVEGETLGDRRGEGPAQRSKVGEDSRERRERQEEGPRGAERWERRNPSTEARKKRDDSEPRLFIACDDNQDLQDSLDSADKSDKAPATLSLGMDLNLDWMTLDEFQKHLNGEDEILSAPPLSPSELRDAVKSGDYMSVKLALNSKEDYNLDQEDSSGMSLCMLAAAGGQDDILRLLIKKGVKMNGRQKNGTTALMHAAEKNFLTTVAILLEAGSFVNAQTLGGETALMKACKRGNADVVRLLLEYGADCNITSKHKNTAMYFAKVSNNVMVFDLIKDHIQMLSSVAEDTIRAYFESRLALLEPVFPLACHRLCEGPDFSLEFGYKPSPHTPAEGSGILLFIFHANFLSEISARLCGPCSVHAVVLNDKFQLPIFLDSHFIYSFSPVPGINKLFVRLAESPTAKVKLLICAYRVQLQ